MQILKPIVHETVWGGSKLTPFSGSTCEKLGIFMLALTILLLNLKLSLDLSLGKISMIGLFQTEKDMV